jgi:hypothetical protein
LTLRRAIALTVPLLVLACGRGEKARQDSIAADSVRVAAARDTAQPPRVVPYDPSAPGAMRSGETPIRASGTGGIDSVRTQAAAPRPTPPAASPPKAASPAPAPSAAEDSVGDPVAVVRDYYAAIRAHDFLRAYRMWETSGQRNVRSYAQFASGFDSTETVDVKTGAAGRVEGAAGSRYVTVPVEIDSRLRNGTRQKFTGTYTLRRVVVPGASVAQRRWHLYAASIRQVQ